MRERIWGRALYAAFVGSLLFLAYLAGAATTMAQLFPSQYVRGAYLAGTSLALRLSYASDPYASNLWHPAPTTGRGVTVHRQGRVQPGLTLYTSGHGARALLIALDGRVVHQWYRPYSDVWDSSGMVRRPVADNQIYLRNVRLFPNGDLLAIYDGVGDTPWGYGMVKLDRDSNVLWKNLDHFHHDFAVTGDGHIYGLTHRFRHGPVPGQEHLRPPVLEDFLVVLSPDGRTLREISLLDALNYSPYGRLLWRVQHDTRWNPLHTNALEVLGPRKAEWLRRKVPAAAPGQVLLSFRELSGGTLALLDMERERIVWAVTGGWQSQHDPDVLPDGNILLFDNLGNLGRGGGDASRVIEIDPVTTGVVWSYDGDGDRPLLSLYRSAQERLPNGNTLITESNGGRLLEVTPSGELVWEYLNPVRDDDGREIVPVVSAGQRIDPAGLERDYRAWLQRPPGTAPVADATVRAPGARRP